MTSITAHKGLDLCNPLGFCFTREYLRNVVVSIIDIALSGNQVRDHSGRSDLSDNIAVVKQKLTSNDPAGLTD
jgi:hypothetical protein